MVGFHGQTVVHRPEAQFTLQLGEGGTLARRLGLPVVYDFRAADMAAGGQGAPLVPVYHQALLAGDPVHPPVAVLNIGGVANVTFMGRDEVLLAFDTGPGNAPLDDFMRARTGQAQDWNGQTAATGRADQTVLATALAHPYFASRPPKSLDRNAFTGLELGSLSTPDGAATLTELTVEGVVRASTLLPRPPQTWIVAGGGTHNRTLMARLVTRLAPARVVGADQLGWSADALEAQAFAFLAVRAL